MAETPNSGNAPGPRHEPTKAEQVAEHGLGAEGSPVEGLARNSPFLIVSVLLHVALLAVLAFVTARQPVVSVRPRVLRLDEDVEISEEEFQPPRRPPETLTSISSDSLMRGPALSETADSAAGGAGEAIIEPLRPIGMAAVTAEGDIGDMEGFGDGSFNMVGTRAIGGIGHARAVDEFAIATINHCDKGRTLVVLLIDRSRSVIYGDLPRIIARMDHYFSEVDLHLAEGLRAKGRWTVISYGRRPTFKCPPTVDLERVKAALRGVRVDPSGAENVGAAIDAALKAYGGGDYEYMLIAAITDEAGDDIVSPALLEGLIGRMRKARARFYVFGYEGVFSARKKRISFKLDPEVVKGADRAAIRGFENRVIHGWADAGPECPRPELWWGVNWHTWGVWGGGLNGIPSGFAMYGLNRLVLATRGTYYLLRADSRYDREKLYAQYRPDISSIVTYEKRMSEVPLRRALAKIWREMGTYYLSNDLRSRAVVDRCLKKSLSARKYCISEAAHLKNLLANSKPSGSNWGRWEAHADLTMAELLRFRFMQGQYHAQLSRTWRKTGRALPAGKRFVLRRGKAPQDYVGASEAKKEFLLASQYIERVILEHKGTPWEALGRRLGSNLYPWRCSVVDMPKPPPPGYKPPPQPPALAF